MTRKITVSFKAWFIGYSVVQEYLFTGASCPCQMLTNKSRTNTKILSCSVRKYHEDLVTCPFHTLLPVAGWVGTQGGHWFVLLPTSHVGKTQIPKHRPQRPYSSWSMLPWANANIDPGSSPPIGGICLQIHSLSSEWAAMCLCTHLSSLCKNNK